MLLLVARMKLKKREQLSLACVYARWKHSNRQTVLKREQERDWNGGRGDERVTLLNINKPNSRMRSRSMQLYNNVLCYSWNIFLAKVGTRHPKYVTINNDENGKKRTENLWNEARTERKQNKDGFFLRTPKWMGGTRARWRRRIKLQNFIYLYLCIYLSQQNENKALSTASDRWFVWFAATNSLTQHTHTRTHTLAVKNGIHIVNLAAPLAQLFVSVESTFGFYLFLLFLKIKWELRIYRFVFFHSSFFVYRLFRFGLSGWHERSQSNAKWKQSQSQSQVNVSNLLQMRHTRANAR